MVEEQPITGIHPVALAVVNCDPVGIKLRNSVRTARIEGRTFLLRDFLHQAKKLAGTRLVDPGF